MWPGFKSRCQRHMWVEFVVSSLPCSERFFSWYSGFLLSLRPNTSKFQFDLERGHVSTSSHEVLSAPWVNKLLQFKNVFFCGNCLWISVVITFEAKVKYLTFQTVHVAGWYVLTCCHSIDHLINHLDSQSIRQSTGQLVNYVFKSHNDLYLMRQAQKWSSRLRETTNLYEYLKSFQSI